MAANPWGGGGVLITNMPTAPAPRNIEIGISYLAGELTNPFTGQQQFQDWQAQYMEGSVLLPPMVQSDAQGWIAFIAACNGKTNVFQFPSAFANKFPESLTNGGVSPTALYWRLKNNENKWSIKPGSVYNMTFEIRLAI